MKASRLAVVLSLALLFIAGSTAQGQSARPGVGAIPYDGGVTFRTWAPNASSMGVAGEFSGWGVIPLAKDMPGGAWNGYWSADRDGASVNNRYKFVVNGNDWRRDPRGRRVVNSNGDSIVYDPSTFDWGEHAPNFNRIWRNDLVIYEMHIGTYNGESWLPSTFDNAIDKLPHLKALGISAVKLMPINEFPGDFSWGYNPTDLYAIESSFGGPTALKRFVRACHENGIAVILDVVHNHYGPTDLDIWQYDGWSQNGRGGIYFYNDHRAETDWGHTRPDFGRSEVRDFIKGQIRMFLEDYRVDGFRWDSVFNIRYHSGGTWNPEGSQMLSEVNQMMIDEFGYAVRIAEDHAFDSDVGFEAQWDPQFLSDIRWLATAQSDADRNMDTLAWHLGNGGFHRVVYVESHDTCGDLNPGKHRLAYDIDSGDPDSYWARKRALLANTIVLVSPGIPMFFAGSEMHEWWTFSNNQSIRWGLTNQNVGIVRAYADLIHLRRNFGGISGGLKQPGNVNVHHVDNTAKVVGSIRWDQGGQTDDLLVAIHCSSTPRLDYEMAFPSPGTWYCLYNSDLKAYDESFGGVGPAVGGSVIAGATASLDLGAYSMQIFSKSRPTESATVTFDPPDPSGCGTLLTVTYEPHDGPLQGAESIAAFIGRNNWMSSTNLPLVSDEGVWILEYTIPDLTYELEFSFTDGEAWDNNGGANWIVPVADCGDLASETTWTPIAPQGCVPLSITYHPNGGPLFGAEQVTLHIGRNNWDDVVQIPMDPVNENTWSADYAIPDNTWEVNFVLFDDNGNWDNNNHRDWRILVSECMNVDQPELAITNPAPSTVVPTGTPGQPLHGRARMLEGILRWSNALNRATGTIPYATNWHIPSVPLADGVNVIRVTGSNSSFNANHGSWDSPTNAAYNAGWSHGSNGGDILQPWIINTYGNSTAAIASNETPLSLGPRAWALQAHDSNLAEAIRPFPTPLHAGDTVSFVFENGWINTTQPSSIGIAFQNRLGQNLVQFLFQGGAESYEIIDALSRDSGMGWSDRPWTNTLEILTPLTYRLTFNGQPFEGEFHHASEVLVSRIRFWNYNAGPETEAQLYIGPLSVVGGPLPVFAYSSEVAVTRPMDENLRRVLSLGLSDAGLVATVNNPDGVENNIWMATNRQFGSWVWQPLPAGAYTISNNFVTIVPPAEIPLSVFSIGLPGGSVDAP